MGKTQHTNTNKNTLSPLRPSDQSFGIKVAICLVLILIASMRFWDINVKQSAAGKFPIIVYFTRVIPLLSIFTYLLIQDANHRWRAVRSAFTSPFMFAVVVYVVTCISSALLVSQSVFSAWKATEVGILFFSILSLGATPLTPENTQRIHKIFFGFLLAILLLLLASACAWPAEGFRKMQLRGLIPPLNPNQIGFYGLVTLLYYAMVPRTSKGKPHYWVLAIIFFIFVMGKSRTSYIALALIGSLWVTRSLVKVLILHRVQPIIMAGFVTVVCIVALSLSLAGAQINEFVNRGQTPEEIAGLSHRVTTWQAATLAIQEKPYFGYGLMAASRQLAFKYSHIVTYHKDRGISHVHNSILESLLAAGFIGTTLYLLYIYYFCIRSILTILFGNLKTGFTPIQSFAMCYMIIIAIRSLTGAAYAFICIELAGILILYALRAMPWQTPHKQA